MTLRWQILVSRTDDDPLLPVCPFKTSPCVDSKRPRVYRHHAHMLKHMDAWCWHGNVLNVHTEAFLNPYTFFPHFFSVQQHTQNTHKHTHTHQTHTTTTNNTTTTSTHHTTQHTTSHHNTPQHTTRDRERRKRQRKKTEKERQDKMRQRGEETRQEKMKDKIKGSRENKERSKMFLNPQTRQMN